MKNFKIIFFIMSVWIILISSICFAEILGNESATLATHINVNYDEKNIELKNDDNEVVYPIMYNSRTYLPMEVFALIANTRFEWNAELNSVYLYSSGDIQESVFQEKTDTLIENRNINVTIDDEIKFYYDDELQSLTSADGIAVKTLFYNDNIYLPLRVLSELFDLEVEWNSETYTVTILKNNDMSTEIYSDIVGTPYKDAIEALTELGIINGYEDGTFKPLNSVNRAEYTKLLVTASGLSNEFENAKNETCIYEDVENHWAKGYINIADEHGFIMGYDDGTFKPENAITCKEAIIYTVRALGYKYAVEDNYLTKAQELELTDTLVFNSYEEKLTRGNACNLLWNVLRTNMWDIDGTTNLAKDFDYIKAPTIEDNSYVYNGEEQNVKMFGFYNDFMNISGDKATDVGKYKMIISLKDKNKYLWEIYDKTSGKYTYTSGDQEIEWEITKGKLTVPYLFISDIFTYDGKEKNLKDELTAYKENLMTISGDITGVNAGTYKVTYSLIDKTNYVWADGTIDDQERNWTIGKKRVRYEPTFNGELTYTGEEQEAEFENYDTSLVTVTNNKATNVGTYYATFSLNDKNNYEWIIYNDTQDNAILTSGDQEFEWKIEKGLWNVEVSNLTQVEDSIKTPEYTLSDYAKEAFAWAIEEKIITGRTTSTLVPQGVATRAEVATMIMRFSNMISEVK